MMNRNPQNAQVQYPQDRLLRLNGDIIPDQEMRHPVTLDEHNKPSLMVIKRGRTTGVTVGRANNILSYLCYYFEGKNGRLLKGKPSKEWAIFPFDGNNTPFSDNGDSGSVIVDGLGRIGGLLTGGIQGIGPKPDITCATPISFILRSMHDKGLREPNINPVLEA